MNKFFKKIAILLCVILVAPAVINCLPSVQTITKVEAAQKASVYVTNKTVGIYSTPEYLYVQGGNEKAKYTYASSNKKVVTVDKNGLITGISKGKAKITVTETYKGKKTKVSTVTISVVNAKLSVKSMDLVAYSQYTLPIQYQNYKAKYKLTAADPSIVTVDEKGYLVGLKEGTTTVSVTETYKKKTRNLGSFTVTVVPSYISDDTKSITVGLNTSYYPTSKIDIMNRAWDATYTFESADSSILAIEKKVDNWGDEYYAMTGVANGTTTVTVYEEYKGVKRTVGIVEVTVKEIAVTNFIIDSWRVEADGSLKLSYELGDEDNLWYYLLREPEDASTPVTFASSDEAVVKVDSEGAVKALKTGTATVTATCGNFKAVFNITVYSDDDLDYDDEYDY